jgi:hypothetical protein
MRIAIGWSKGCFEAFYVNSIPHFREVKDKAGHLVFAVLKFQPVATKARMQKI